MKAFHGKKEIKDKYYNRMLKHIEMDELVQKETFDGTKGCFIGCTLNNYNHKSFENELGISESIARLSDGIFEGLSKEDSIDFSREYYTKIKVGADLSMVIPKILLWILSDKEHGVIRFVQEAKFSKQKQAIETVVALLKRQISGEEIPAKEWISASSAADAVAYAYDTAYADAASSAAYAIAYAADAAAYAAYTAYTAAYAAAYANLKNKLFELFEECQ